MASVFRPTERYSVGATEATVAECCVVDRCGVEDPEHSTCFDCCSCSIRRFLILGSLGV